MMSAQHAPGSRQRAQRRARIVVAIGISAVLALTACTSAAPEENTDVSYELTEVTPAPSGDLDTVTFSSYAEPFSLDYAYAFDYADNQVLANICEPLLRLNADYTLTPALAESFSHPTPNTWVYEIRQGVTFHDGTPLTPADVVASFQRHVDPAVGSAWYSVFQNVTSVEQTGEHQVTVTESLPDSQFNLAMGGSAGIVESAATLAAAGADYGNSTGGVNCTGPFSLDSWQSGESITMKRYDDYWDKDLMAKAAEFKIIFMNDPNARVNSWKSGEVDGGWMVPVDAIAQLRGSDVGDVYFGMNTAVSNLIISNLEGPLKDPNVRKALLMAIDREGLIQAAGQGIGTVTSAMTTESVWVGASKSAVETAFGDLEDYPYDLEAAKKLIEEAGVAGEELVFATAPLGTDFAVIAQSTVAAAKAIGLDARIETLTPNAYTTLFSDPSAREGFDLFYTIWYLSSPDPLEMYSVLREGEFSNYGNWVNPEFDAIVNEAITIEDPAARSEKTAQAQLIANAELPWLPLSEGPITLFMSDRVTGVAPSINFLYYPWAATIGAR